MTDDNAIVPYEDPDNADNSDDSEARDTYDKDETLAQPNDETKTPVASTRVLDNQNNSAGTRKLAIANASNDTPPLYFRFLVREGNGRIQKPASHSLIVGRRNSSRPVDVDLFDYDAIELGISRQHVKIEPRGQGFVVKDLHTINGTTLNKQRMNPGHYYSLHDGDELKMGRMHVIVRFVWE